MPYSKVRVQSSSAGARTYFTGLWSGICTASAVPNSAATASAVVASHARDLEGVLIHRSSRSREKRANAQVRQHTGAMRGRATARSQIRNFADSGVNDPRRAMGVISAGNDGPTGAFPSSTRTDAFRSDRCTRAREGTDIKR